MMTTEFRQQVLAPIQAQFPSVRLPDIPKWSVGADLSAVVELTTDQLSGNMQQNTAAAPLFLLCLVLRLRAAGRPWRAIVRVKGGVTLPSGPLSPGQRHFARSMFLLQLYRELFSDFFQVESGGTPCDEIWEIPERAVLNQESDARTRLQPKSKGNLEHELEAHFITHKGDGSPQEQFARIAGRIGAFRRQLPLGLFRDGVVSKATAVMPTGKSAVDAWTTSSDGKTFHLLELKAGGNLSVGTLAEVLSYSTLLAKYRADDIGHVGPLGAALAAVRSAQDITGWFATPRQHPLVGDEADVVISAFNKALRPRRVALRTMSVKGRPPSVTLAATR